MGDLLLKALSLSKARSYMNGNGYAELTSKQSFARFRVNCSAFPGSASYTQKHS